MKIEIRQQSFSRPLLMMLAACFSKVQLLSCNYEILQSSSLTKKNSEAAASRIFFVCAEKNRVERGELTMYDFYDSTDIFWQIL